MDIILLGPPGAGKGTQAQRRVLIQDPKRQTARGMMQQERSHLPLKLNTAGVIPPIFASSLLLLPNTIAGLSATSGAAAGFIFDGFPRTIPQAKALDEMLAGRGARVDVVIRLKVDEPALIARITKRFEAEGRADDNPESFKKRLVAYNQQTAPLLPVYAEQGKLKEIDGMQDVATVSDAISGILDGAAQAAAKR